MIMEGCGSAVGNEEWRDLPRVKEEATMLQVFSFDSKPDITGLAKMFPFDNKCCIREGVKKPLFR